MDIMVWLRSLGLEKYEPVFRENEIDADVLPELTELDFEKLGVPLGHRKRLLKAIAALRNDASGKLLSVDTVTTSTAPSAHPEDRAERRHVTVMFSDLVGSTALSARMDPEDLREVISTYQKCVAETVQRFGGFVAKYMGDGVLIYYGYPHAHEDDAERAVRSGLELVAAVGDLKTHAPLQTRVGIATGMVVVGDLIGSGASQEQAIVGETPNLAARLQGIAEPNSVVVAESTRKLIGNLFELEDVGAQDLKGIAGPVRAWAALRPSSVESRFEAMHASGLTELVGREEELELLLRRWSKARSGEGQVVLLSGEPGIGKSRLTAAFMERLAAQSQTRLRYFCSPQHTDSALYPIISQIERTAGFAHDDTAQSKLDKLDALLAQSSTPPQDAALLAEMLSLQSDGRYPTLDLTPQQRRERTLQTLTAQLKAVSRENPVLMIFEDAHWIDPTTLEALGKTVDRIRSLPVLLIVTHRPEFQPPWIGRSYVAALHINRLGEREIVALIGRVAGDNSLPESVRQDIIERTDGVPLFVEEMTKAVLEAGAEVADQRTSPSFAVPASLHASLMARLDRLGPAKKVAQVGAAIGREFSHALLAALVREDDTKLQLSLERLVLAGLLLRQGQSQQGSYLFKHALVRDIAYGSMLRADRQRLHAQIGQMLEKQSEQTGPEILAHHFYEAGLPEKAISYSAEAGQIANLRQAYVEAISHLTKGLGLLEQLPNGKERDLRELYLRSAFGIAYIATKGYSAPETIASYKRAAELLWVTDDTRLRLAIQSGLYVAYYNLAQFDSALKLAQEILREGERNDADAVICVAHRLVAATCNGIGDPEKARHHAARGWESYRPERHGLPVLRLFHDTGVGSKSHWAFALCQLGFHDQARRVGAEALALAAELRHINSQAFAMFYAGLIVSFIGREHDALSKYAARLRAVGQQHGMPQWAAWGRAFGAVSSVASGFSSSALDEIAEAINDCEAIQCHVFRPTHLTIVALAELAVGRIEQAVATTASALDIAEGTGENWLSAETWRLRGDALTALNRIEEAEECFQRGLGTARSQSARCFEVRTATSLARLWRDQGKVQQARELLAPVYGWFTEGFDTRDLKEAKALLDALAT
jgi:class 3 adenylate cyclase/tetratricopeptide (TPR) repeat protein